MAASHRGAISFGLVHIPAALYTATQNDDISYNQLHNKDHSRIKYKKVCAHCGKEVSSTDIVKGYEYDKDKYVIITDDELEAIKTEKDKTIQILHFTDLQSVRPIYYERTYHVLPEAGGEKAFELLRAAMKATGKVAIGKTVIGTKETLLCILPTDDGLLVETLYFANEVKAAPKAYTHPEVDENELAVAINLIEAMNKEFEPELYHDEFQQKQRKLIEQKIAGKEIVTAKPEQSVQQGNIINLMDALKASLEQQQQTETGKKRRGGRKKAGA